MSLYLKCEDFIVSTKSLQTWHLPCIIIARFRYFKIQLETKDITMRLREINHINLSYHSPKLRSDVFCFMLNFNISKLDYSCKKYCMEILQRL